MWGLRDNLAVSKVKEGVFLTDQKLSGTLEKQQQQCKAIKISVNKLSGLWYFI